MAICIDCDNSMEEGAKFCSNCGRSTSGESDFFRKKGKSKQSRSLLEIEYIFKNILLKPLTTVLEVKKILSSSSTFLLIAILSLINGLLGIWGVKVVPVILNSKFKRLISDYLMSLGIGTAPGVSDYATVTIKMRYDEMFFHGVIIYLLVIFTLFVGLFLFYKFMLKGKEGAITLWQLAAVATIPIVVAEFLALFVSYISPLGSLGIIIFAFTFSALILYKGVNSLVEEKENKIIFIIPIIYFFVAIIACLVIAYMMKFMKLSVFSPFSSRLMQ